MAVPPRAILFDADGVLQHMTVEWRDELSERSGEEGPETDRLHDAIAQAEKPTMTGEIDLADSLVQVLDDHDTDLEVHEVLEVWQNIEVDEAVLDGVRSLAGRGIIRALTTNQAEQRAAWMRANLPYDDLFDAHFYSCEIGLAKPDPDYFRHVLDALGVAAEDALFMDDTLVNVESAAELGLRAELFARDGGRAELDRILGLHGLL
ncbi:HAD family hydrolase [uncultured Friedmanniella sp.]|uniref:HAD family hydrolase n=1 Tax=uncultured Friedmanniella sp. TaxID=335381 RepID=UPI0035CA3D0B